MKGTLRIVFSITASKSLYKNTRYFSRDFHVLLNIAQLCSTLSNQTQLYTMTAKNESVFTMQPLSPDDYIKKSSFTDPHTSDVEPGQTIITSERGVLHQSFSPRKLQVITFCLDLLSLTLTHDGRL